MIGGIISGVGSIINANATNRASKKALEQQQENIKEGKKAVKAGYDEVDAILADYEKKVQSSRVTDDDDLADYKGMVKNYDPTQYVAERGTFDKDAYDVADYINENRDAIVKKAAESVQRTAAGAGVGRGTGAAMDIAQAVVDADETLEDKAYERMKDDRNFDYTEFQNQYAANQAALDKLNEGYKTRMEVLGGAIATDQQTEADYIADKIASKTGRTNATVNLLT